MGSICSAETGAIVCQSRGCCMFGRIVRGLSLTLRGCPAEWSRTPTSPRGDTKPVGFCYLEWKGLYTAFPVYENHRIRLWAIYQSFLPALIRLRWVSSHLVIFTNCFHCHKAANWLGFCHVRAAIKRETTRFVSPPGDVDEGHYHWLLQTELKDA